MGAAAGPPAARRPPPAGGLAALAGELLSARARRDELWARICAGVPGGAAEQDERELLQGLAVAADKHRYLFEAFEHEGDELPRSRADLARLRGPGANLKLFHAVGAAARVRLVVRDGPYSGLLAPDPVGVPGVLRASTNATHLHLPGQPRQPRFSPGIAVKLFLDAPPDGQPPPTQNLLAIYRLEGAEPGMRDFFGVSLHTAVELPRAIGVLDKTRWHAVLGVFQGALAAWSPSGEDPPNPLRLDLAPLCAHTRAGEPVTPVAPRWLTFHPSPDAHRHEPEVEDFRERLRGFPAGEALYTAVDQDGLEVGQIVVEDGFVATDYADERLFFRHPLLRGGGE